MAEAQELEAIPEWDLADRMRKAMRYAGYGVQDMAEYLGVTRTTVSTWINGRNRPSRPAMRVWALRCGVSLGWLDGTESGNLRFSTPAQVAA
jgi:transcriptional regulator with XRE-family HTH domain